LKGLARFGPGLMMAATAVGVSHLVHATRAGAGYGLSLAVIVIVIVLLKYPAFRFAVEYASVTGNSLVHAYVRQGRIAVGWLLITMLIEILVGTSVLSLITAGVLISVFDLPVSASVAAVIVAMLTAAILLNGRYEKAEGIVKFLVVAFSLTTLMVTAIAVPELGTAGRGVLSPLELDRTTINFMVAMTGYMPLPLAVAVFHSIWVREKKKICDYPVSRAVLDLNIGWCLTAILALSFMVIGAAVLYQSEVAMPDSAPAFAAMLFAVFTGLAGDWIYPVLAAGGVAVVWSTLVAILDAVPRILDRLWREMGAREESVTNYYPRFLVLQVVGASFVLTFLLGDFAAFVDISASLTFLIAPAIAFYNYRAVTSPEVAAEFRTSMVLVRWNQLSIVAFVLFAITFAVLRFW